MRGENGLFGWLENLGLPAVGGSLLGAITGGLVVWLLKHPKENV